MPESVLSALRLSPEEFGRELRPAAATHWYERGRISQERAAQVAGLSRELRDDVIARINPETGDVESLELLFLSTRLLGSVLFELPIVAHLRRAD